LRTARSNWWKKSFLVHFHFRWLAMKLLAIMSALSRWLMWRLGSAMIADFIAFPYSSRKFPSLGGSYLFVTMETSLLSLTPQLSSHPWSLLECHPISVSVSWLSDHWPCPFYVVSQSQNSKSFSGPSHQIGERRKRNCSCSL